MLVGEVVAEEVEESVAEVVGVAVWIAELVGDGAEEVIAGFRVELFGQFHHECGLRGVIRERGAAFLAGGEGALAYVEDQGVEE